jgi:hypothetical protein
MGVKILAIMALRVHTVSHEALSGITFPWSQRHRGAR